MTYIDRAIKSWLSWRARRRLERQTERFLKAAPEIAAIRSQIAQERRNHHRRSDLLAKAHTALHDRLSAEVWGA